MAKSVAVVLCHRPQLAVLLRGAGLPGFTSPAMLQRFFLSLVKEKTRGPSKDRADIVWQKLLPAHRSSEVLNPMMAVLPKVTPPPGYVWTNLADLNALDLPYGAILNQAVGKLWVMFANGYRSRQFRAALKLPSWMVKTKFKARDELIFFGGSFNPWHDGHRACVELCHQVLPKGKIIIVPDHNPWKKLAAQTCFWAALRQLGTHLAETPFSIFPGFYGLEQEHPTVSWLLKHEGHKKSFLIGDDNLMSFLSWQQAPALLKNLYRLIVVPRIATAAERALQMARLKKFNPALKFTILPDHPFKKVASSKIRH